ncbi:MAG: thermonuclease family protein [Limnohabitans sp.]
MNIYRRQLAAAITLTVTLLMAYAPSTARVPHKEVSGRIVRVTDGDTVTLLSSDNTRIKIRLAGIDAPESRMPYGHAAQVHLAELVLNKEVIAVTHKHDRYGRTVATLWVGTKDVNLTMVQDGLAWHGTTNSMRTSSPKIRQRTMPSLNCLPEQKAVGYGNMTIQCLPGCGENLEHHRI